MSTVGSSVRTVAVTAAGAWFTYHAVDLVHGILLVGYPKQVGLPAVD